MLNGIGEKLRFYMRASVAYLLPKFEREKYPLGKVRTSKIKYKLCLTCKRILLHILKGYFLNKESMA